MKLFLFLFFLCHKLEASQITLTFVGDVTLGNDVRFNGETFNWQFQQVNDYTYFTKNVYNIFKQDDLTIANLEGTLTNYNIPEEKKYRFKGDPSYANILKYGSIELVNLSNNHSHDYGETGFKDTLNSLKNVGVNFYGEGYIFKTVIKGKKICFLGYQGWNLRIKKRILKDIKLYRKDNDILITTFHWGTEHTYHHNSVQKQIAEFCIDNGSDLVLGHHTHTVQDIEYYKGKPIIYSLGNFIFGGNNNPSDKKTVIYQIKFNENLTYEDKLIPAFISSAKNRNNFQPILLATKK